MARVYATQQEYRDWSGDQSAVLTPRDLARASRVVTEASSGAVYDLDVAGMPTGATLAALKEATFEVLAARAVTTAAGPLGDVEEATIGSVRFKLKAGTEQAPVTGLPVEAHRVLAEAGMVGQPVIVYG